MKATVIQFTFGIVAFDEQNRLVAHVLFSKKPQQAAKRLMNIESGKISELFRESENLLLRSKSR